MRDIARSLKMLWDGMGGAYPEQLPGGRVVWRIHDQWGGIGGSAVLDAATEELLSIEETPPERDVSVMKLPPQYIPEEADLVDFARKQLGILNWPQPASMAARPWKTDKSWIVQSTDAETPAITLVMEGGRGHLHLTRASRI